MPKGELEFIRRIRPLLNRGGDAAVLGVGDDMAVLPFPADRLLLSTDMIMDGVDFRSEQHSWRQIGYKAMAINLSDCAAMAVRPVAALCALSLQDTLSMDDALEIMSGVRDCSTKFACPIVGGDTNSWSAPTVVCITVAAEADGDRPPVRRGGARAGDSLCLSGPVGGSLLARHLTPEPRIETALAINRRLEPHAMIDISDGLAVDLWHMLDESGCGALLDETALTPMIHPDAHRQAARDGVSPREHALHDGEDFELLIALPPRVTDEQCRGLGLTRIGRCTDETGCRLKTEDGARIDIERRGWEHFR